MEKLSKKIKDCRKLKGWTQEELAERADVKPLTIGRHENPSYENTNLNTVKKIAKALGKPLSYFLEDEPIKEDLTPLSTVPLKDIPVISKVSAFHWISAEDPLPVGDAIEWLSSPIKTSEKAFYLIVENHCMQPKYYEGDYILVDPEKMPENGQLAVIKRLDTDEVTFKQIKFIADKVILHPLNPEYEDIILNSEKEYQIIGKVVGSFRKT